MSNNVFNKVIRISDHDLDFSFRKLPGDYQNFHAEVTDLKGNRIQFTLYQDAHHRWHTTGTLLPMWISGAEATIGEAIQMQMSPA